MSVRNVYMIPTLENAKRDQSNSINQIVRRVSEYLPMYGWSLTSDPSEADLVAVHAGMGSAEIDVDVAHCHGLYPTALHNEPNKQWHHAANANVIQSLRRAKAITVPSTWVAEIIRRDLNREPTIVHWAIQSQEWHAEKHEGYTLWNKTRPSAVCDPTPIEHLARSIPDAQFVTTFAKNEPPPNLEVTGRKSFEEMRKIVSRASLYLATTKETFGIGTLEAMAAGIPVLGYAWGGTNDIVEHGVTGYLVEPNDLEGLVTGWRYCMRHRKVLGDNARTRAYNSHYTYDRVAQQFAALYDRVYNRKLRDAQRPAITVIVPTHNYAQYLPQALYAVAHQSIDEHYELIIVDDSSSDETPQVIAEFVASEAAQKSNLAVRHIRCDYGNVARTRNLGAEWAEGRYLMFLDADDRLASENALALLFGAMEADSTLGVAYGSLLTQTPQGGITKSPFPAQFDADAMLEQNQVPTCNLIRREAFQQAGGYRPHLTPAEDAGLWLEINQLGWNIRKVTEEAILVYRLHSESLSHPVRMRQKVEPNWKMTVQGGKLRFASRATPKEGRQAHLVRNYDRPLISVIIPVGPNHSHIVRRALDSLVGQTEQHFEAIVINDSQAPLVVPHKWAKVLNAGGRKQPVGTGAARNEGIAFAEGKYITFLDADDYLLPEALEQLLLGTRISGDYSYGDWALLNERGALEVSTAPIFDTDRLLQQQPFPITIMMPREFTEGIAFHESLPAWEDWDYLLQLREQGRCGKAIGSTTLVYDMGAGERREFGHNNRAALLEYFQKRWRAKYKDKTAMCKCDQVNQIKIGKFSAASAIANGEDLVRVYLAQGGRAKQTVIGAATKTRYKRAQRGDVLFVRRDDAIAEPERFVPISQLEEGIRATPEPPAPTPLDRGRP